MDPTYFPLPNPAYPAVTVLCANAEAIKVGPLHKPVVHGVATKANLWISSQGYTLDSGVLTFKLENLTAGGAARGGEAVIISPDLAFLATALAETPVVLTWTKKCTKQPRGLYNGFFDLLEGTTLTGKNRYDVEITVRSWTLAGTPAPHVWFGWVCVAEGAGWEEPA